MQPAGDKEKGPRKRPASFLSTKPPSKTQSTSRAKKNNDQPDETIETVEDGDHPTQKDASENVTDTGPPDTNNSAPLDDRERDTSDLLGEGQAGLSDVSSVTTSSWARHESTPNPEDETYQSQFDESPATGYIAKYEKPFKEQLGYKSSFLTVGRNAYSPQRKFFLCKTYNPARFKKPIAILSAVDSAEARHVVVSGGDLDIEDIPQSIIKCEEIDMSNQTVVSAAFFDDMSSTAQADLIAEAEKLALPPKKMPWGSVHISALEGVMDDESGDELYDGEAHVPKNRLYVCVDHHVNSNYSPTTVVVARDKKSCRIVLDTFLSVVGLKPYSRLKYHLKEIRPSIGQSCVVYM